MVNSCIMDKLCSFKISNSYYSVNKISLGVIS